MTVLSLDDRRRVTLPRSILENARQRFVAIRTPEGILLKPIPEDPIEALQKEGQKLKGRSIRQLRRTAYQQAVKEAVK